MQVGPLPTCKGQMGWKAARAGQHRACMCPLLGTPLPFAPAHPTLCLPCPGTCSEAAELTFFSVFNQAMAHVVETLGVSALQFHDYHGGWGAAAATQQDAWPTADRHAGGSCLPLKRLYFPMMLQAH